MQIAIPYPAATANVTVASFAHQPQEEVLQAHFLSEP
jgi:hypothetical protein